MRNFMCYRDGVPPLYFEGISTACISGDNGNGKSALIDAMTWALWGETRTTGTKISDDDLIHQGQTEMEVEFDFAIEQQLYRIIRKHAKPKRRRASGKSSLDLLIAGGNGFKPISGNSIYETQEKIKATLHMDYDTFVNSAFLRQGHADEFTKQPPTKRKDVLAKILGLSVYDELETQAKDLAKQQEMEIVQLESAIREIDGELAQKPDYEARLTQAQGELARVEKAAKEQEAELNRRRQEKESLENKKSQLLQLEEHLSQTEREISQWDEQLRQRRSRIKEYEEVIGRRAAIEEGYAKLLEAKKINEELDRKLGQLRILENRKHQMEMAIQQAQAALTTEHKLAQSRIEELEVKWQKLPQLRNELRQVEAQLHQLAEPEDALRRKRQTGQELQAQLSSLEAESRRLEQEIAGIEDKLKLLLAQHEAKCPLCETELGIDRIKLIETKYTADREHKSDWLRSTQAGIAQKRTEVKSLQSEISRLEEGLGQAKASAQGKANILGREIAEAEAAGSRLGEERERLAGLEQRLAGKDFATVEQRALAEFEAELAKLSYDSQQHDVIRQRLASLQQYENPKRKLEEADRLIDQEREVAARAEQAAEQRRQALETENQRRQQLISELAALPRLDSELAQAEAEYQALAARQKQAQEILWGVKAKLERCLELESKRKEKGKLLGQASKEERIYKDLAQAFGKNGIQAILIETALPEIEAEANRLLARMTDNRMHVKIETQRPKKTGGVIETLDIYISDELGPRPYELFSGGEAFRINFAIRIALSKLLARRAGAPLRTLIIDEGFGTQDASGLEKIKEAINSIQEDFDKILVITHIEELRDAFPTRIDVTKTASGSTIEVS
jgi:exonuclease SbcC